MHTWRMQYGDNYKYRFCNGSRQHAKIGDSYGKKNIDLIELKKIVKEVFKTMKKVFMVLSISIVTTALRA